MKAVALFGAIGSLVLGTLAAAPADGAETGLRVPAPKKISWGRCAPVEHLPAGVECGKVSVPLDYAHPEGRKIDLTVSRRRASGPARERQGALLYNPGGPGGSAMAFPMYGGLPEWRRTARAYDFVGYAPRGVGRSAPLSCEDPEQSAKAPSDSPVHPSERFKQQKIKEAREYAEGCARRAGSALQHYNTLNNARDLEMLRVALGEKKLTFMGASYGTYLGAVYATLFPGNVRRMVFDSVVNPDPDKVWYQNNLEQNIAFEGRWHDWRAWVAKHHKTYRLGTTAEAVGTSYYRAAAQLRRKPAGGKVGPAQLQSAFLMAGYSDHYWPIRAAALSKYLKGDPKPLIAQAAPDPADAASKENGDAVYSAVECNDADWPRDWATWDRDNTIVSQVAPFETWDNAWMNLPCAFWPRPARTLQQQRPLDVRTAPGVLPPVLLLAAERDGATPYEGARELHRRLAGSTLVTERDAGTHGIAFSENDCVNKYTEDYLLTGRVPERDAFCKPHKEPEPGEE
ncbi:alpha/beta hydrolase [Streptomyces ochraceiscleroticus]|uniref:Alpha/beta hydrolase n=1 Tax=Streptomyces ochraceiscleroticus TaxID=47761 RepID=A0ABW1MT17_9ACTN|nr:alpha/beta hydrolase [Streptomyces ochraceiscleroticus]